MILFITELNYIKRNCIFQYFQINIQNEWHSQMSFIAVVIIDVTAPCLFYNWKTYIRPCNRSNHHIYKILHQLTYWYLNTYKHVNMQFQEKILKYLMRIISYANKDENIRFVHNVDCLKIKTLLSSLYPTGK